MNANAEQTSTPGHAIIGRWGLTADLRRAHVVWTVGERSYLAEVIGVYRREMPSAWMLRVRHLNGEPMPDVALSAVQLLHRL